VASGCVDDVGADQQVVEVEIAGPLTVGADATHPGGQVDHQVGGGGAEQLVGGGRVAQVALRRGGGDHFAGRQRGQRSLHRRTQKAGPPGDQHATYAPEIGHVRIVPAAPCHAGAVQRPTVAVPLQFCWQSTPGGTGRAAIELTAALRNEGLADVVGVVPRIGTPTEGYEPSVPTAAAPALPWPALPAPLLNSAWQRLGWPSIEGAVAAAGRGHVDLVHLMAPIVPRRGSAPLVATLHDLFPLRFPSRSAVAASP
jgi:hypothetical protein